MITTRGPIVQKENNISKSNCTRERQTKRQRETDRETERQRERERVLFSVTSFCGRRGFFASTYSDVNHDERKKWPFATLWLTDELVQSTPAYKDVSSDMPAGCPSSIVVYSKHAAALLSETPVTRFGAVQVEPRGWTHVILFTSLV